jgi:hypothetical protein
MHADMSAINPTKTLALAIRSIIVLLAAFSRRFYLNNAAQRGKIRTASRFC